MTIRSLAAALAAAFVCAAWPAFSSAQNGPSFQNGGAPGSIFSPPIKIDAFQLSAGDFPGLEQTEIQFTNIGQVTVTKVTFAMLSDNNVIGTYPYSGKFSPGIRITWEFQQNQSARARSPYIVLAGATLADGSSYTNTALPQKTGR